MVNGTAAPFALVALLRARVAAWPLCPISERYRIFVSSQASGNADRFPPAALHSSKILNLGGVALAFAGGALSDAKRSSGNEVDPGFQAWCAGRPHGIPAEQRAMEVSLCLTAFLAPHGVKASAMPDQLFDLHHAQAPRGSPAARGPNFVTALRAREVGRQKPPSSTTSRSDL